ncbi:MAG TPA: hypothetical protein VL463_19705 [Kofleriaceae bacterium]|nr:hypothetical protein [Kofleriaceae bacterium]
MRATLALVLVACARHPEQQPARAPLPPLPGTPDAGATGATIDAAPPPVVLAFAPAPWGRGDRVRVETDEGDAKVVTTVMIDTPEPAVMVAMIDKRVPDPDHAVGTSCTATMAAEGPTAPAQSLACTLAVRRMAALVDLADVGKSPRTEGDHADGLGRIPLDLIGAAPSKTTAVLESFLDHQRAVLLVTADGTRDGRAIHLRGRITVDHTLTTAVGHFEGTDGDRALIVHVDIGPAD